MALLSHKDCTSFDLNHVFFINIKRSLAILIVLFEQIFIEPFLPFLKRLEKALLDNPEITKLAVFTYAMKEQGKRKGIMFFFGWKQN